MTLLNKEFDYIKAEALKHTHLEVCLGKSSEDICEDDLPRVFDFLDKNPSVTGITISGDLLSDHTIITLAFIYSISFVRLSLTELSDRSIEFLSNRSHLISLDLSNTQLTCSQIKLLCESHTLKSLSIRFTDEYYALGACKDLGNNTSFRILNFSGCALNDDCAAALASHKTLNNLSVSPGNIGLAGAKALAKMSTLITLTIANNQLGDKGAKALLKSKSLKQLDIYNNGLTKRAIALLEKNTRFTKLYHSAPALVTPKEQENIADDEAWEMVAPNRASIRQTSANYCWDVLVNTMGKVPGLFFNYDSSQKEISFTPKMTDFDRLAPQITNRLK